MAAPYREGGEPGDEATATEERRPLGARLSSHSDGLFARVTAVLTPSAPAVSFDLHENGLVAWMRGRGRVELLFDDIDAVHHDFEGIRSSPGLVLVRFDGARFIVPRSLGGGDRVAAAIDRAVTRPIMARAKEALARGERLVFGPLVVELDGLLLRGASVSWAALAQVIAEREVLVFYVHGTRARFGWVRIADVPHLRALLAVLRMRTRVVMAGLRVYGEPT